MSQIIVDKCMKPKPVNTTNEDDNNEETDPTEILRNKQQGYRRVSPADKPVKENATSKNTNQERYTNQDRNDRVRNTHEDGNDRERNARIQYCHFCNNSGRFGRPCRFAHKLAPICNFDAQCARPKCMFRHNQQTENFLEVRQNLHPRFPTVWNQNFPMRTPASQNPWFPFSKRNHQ